MTVDRDRLKQRLQDIGETPERAALLAGVLSEEFGEGAPPSTQSTPPPSGPNASPPPAQRQQSRPTSAAGRGHAEAEKRFGGSRPVASVDHRGVIWTGRR